MKTSRRTLSVAALLALAAWANVQAMACCWMPDVISAVKPFAGEMERTDGKSMAADHSCCPGSGTASGSEAASPEGPTESGACGMDARGFSSVCCESGEVAAVSAATTYSVTLTDVFPAFALVLARLPAASQAEASGSVPETGKRPGSGPPVYLSVRHFLI